MKKERTDLFYYIFAFWYSMDIVLRTDIQVKANLFLRDTCGFINPDINKCVDILVLLLLLFQIIFLQKYTKQELFIIFFTTFPFAIAVITSGSNTLISLMLFIIASKNVEIDEVIRIAYIILCFSIPLVIILCFIGVLPDYTMYRNDLLRHSLGFEHPNRLGMRVFQFMACHSYLFRNSKRRALTYLLFVLSIIFVYKVPNSQTAYISLGFLLILYFIYHIVDKSKVGERLFMRAFVFFTVFINIGSVALCFLDPVRYPLYNSIDRFMSRRFYFCYHVYKHYGLTWFGQKVSTLVNDGKYVGVFRQLYLDNAFFSILLCYGIVVYLVFCLMYFSAAKYYMNKGNLMMLAILFLYTLYGVMTTGFYMVSHNIFLLTTSCFFYGYEDGVEVKNKRKIVRLIWSKC